MITGMESCSFCVVLLVGLLLPSVRAVVCSADDIKYMFTPCTAGGTTEAVAFYSKDCGAGSLALPPPKPAPCVMECPSGTFYSPQYVNCTPCSRGEFSNSGGKIINTFKTFPDDFATYCSPSPCSVWGITPGEESLDSGNQSVGGSRGVSYYGADDSVESSLVMIFDIINVRRGGNLMFQYRVESEKLFDGLKVLLNGTDAKNTDSTVGSDRFFATGLHHQWRQASIALPYGRVEVKFVYSKDANQLSDSGKFAGVDRAFLKDFTIEGVQLFAPECSKCAAGEYSDVTGASDCKICSKNTYSGVAAPGCTNCNFDDSDTKWAPPGSSVCFTKANCSKNDYVAVYTACGRNGKRIRTWSLTNSRCTETSDSRPKTDTVECAGCMPGFIRAPSSSSDGSTVCVACPEGQILDSSSGSCKMCDPGTAAIPTLTFSDGFDHWNDGAIPASFATTSCTGLCAGCVSGSAAYCTAPDTGFELSSYPNNDPNDPDGTIVGIRSSVSGGSYWTSTLTIPIQLLSRGTLDLEYMFAFQQADSTASVVPRQLTATLTLDGQETLFDHYYVGPTLRGRLTQYMDTAGSHTAKITVSQFGRIDPSESVSLVILRLNITGDSRGAASTCQRCETGNFCPGNTSAFVPCPVAQMQPRGGQTSCMNCSAGTISKEAGSTWCRWCNFGTYAAPTHDLCINTCNITFGGNNYDFTALRSVVFGPLYPPGARTDLSPEQADAHDIHRFFVSPCAFVNSNKSANVCSLLYGGAVEDAYACQRLNGNRSYSIGDDILYRSTMAGQLMMSITGGNPCTDGTERSTNITFVCDPDSTPGVMQFMGESPKCHYNFLFSSSYGCPRCTVDSFSKVTSDCTSDNVTTVAYFRQDFAKSCIGGYIPPAAVNYSCSRCSLADFEQVWSACVGGQQTNSWVKLNTACLDDGKLVFPAIATVRSCSTINAELGFNGFTLSIAIVLAFASALFYGIYTLYTRHSKLQVEYHRLSNNANEMADVGDDEAQGDEDAFEEHNE